MGPAPDIGAPGWIAAAFTIVPIVIALVLALIAVLIVVNVRRAKRLGVNPLTVQTDVAARIARDGLGGGRPLADRLAELDALRAAGTISEAEHASARRAALGGG
ncbi:SHOCT domain-containing protein [Rathayibacter sp. VKM Ac-2801]|uniref:SHOCT domain-containing protein n=1 Tax=Rathayibacter sp. VKM Ac-2801 TaxID=2609255 RepID=UPI00131F7CB0|nr:SHOCT domain-containing protein [Rathayibacter sp. VKM Ac-2801]QHC70205.1 SHOCT domain-containing protein [Rathayibacter sp. VKM Ac-2801]